MSTVYVLNKDGKPLMPTTRCGHVRHLLKEQKARVVTSKPFTIQLLYEADDVVQSLYLGIDPGRTNIGVAVVKVDGTAVFTAHLETRNKEIPKLMKKRKESRRARRTNGRRCRRQRRAKANGTISKKCVKHDTAQNGSVSKRAKEIGVIKRHLPGCEKDVLCIGIKNKEAKFSNRTKSEGWLTPTANQLLQTHINLVKKIRKFLPISDVVLEINKFAFMRLDNPNVQKWQYQQGPLYQKANLEETVSEMQEHHCLFCKKKIDHYHHVVPQHKNGSNTIDNIVGLCTQHHDLVHKDATWQKRLAKKKTGLNKKYGALSVLNQIIPALTKKLSSLFLKHFYELLNNLTNWDGRAKTIYLKPANLQEHRKIWEIRSRDFSVRHAGHGATHYHDGAGSDYVNKYDTKVFNVMPVTKQTLEISISFNPYARSVPYSSIIDFIKSVNSPA